MANNQYTQLRQSSPGMQTQITRAMDPTHNMFQQKKVFTGDDIDVDRGSTEKQIDLHKKGVDFKNKISNAVTDLQVKAANLAATQKPGAAKAVLTLASRFGKKDNIQDPTAGSHGKGRRKGTVNKKGLYDHSAFSPCPGGVCKNPNIK